MVGQEKKIPYECLRSLQIFLRLLQNAYEYEPMSDDELANIVICKQIRAIIVSPLFLGCFRSNPFDTCRYM